MRILVIVASLISLVFGASAVSAQQQAQQPPFKPTVDAKQLMHAVVIPSSNVVFRVEVEPPQDDQQWENVLNNATALAEAGNLLMLPGRAKNNDDWMKRAQALVDVGVKAMKAAEAKDPDAVVKVGYEIFDVCAACHDEYMPSRKLGRLQREKEQQEKQQQKQ